MPATEGGVPGRLWRQKLLGEWLSGALYPLLLLQTPSPHSLRL